MLEFILVSKETDYKGPDYNNREFERKFMSEVYPFCTKLKLFAGRACCDDWELKIDHTWTLEYFEICGLFKFGDYLNANFKASDIFGDCDGQVWVRVWYKDVYNGLVKGNLEKISDECLVHVAHELGIEDPEEQKVGVLFEECNKIIRKRYFQN